MKILIVDDERSIRYSLKEILEMEDYQVDTAENGADACEMAEKEKYATPSSATSRCPAWTERKSSRN